MSHFLLHLYSTATFYTYNIHESVSFLNGKTFCPTVQIFRSVCIGNLLQEREIYIFNKCVEKSVGNYRPTTKKYKRVQLKVQKSLKNPIKMGCAVSNAREKEAQERSKNIDKLLKSEAEKNACIKLLLLGMRQNLSYISLSSYKFFCHKCIRKVISVLYD